MQTAFVPGSIDDHARLGATGDFGGRASRRRRGCRDATKMNNRAGLLNKLISTSNHRFLMVNLLVRAGLVHSSARGALLVLTSVSFTLPASVA
jgi:hypothetical protein